MKLIYSLIIIASLLFVAACGGENTSGKPKAKENGEQYVGDEQGNGIHYVYKNWIIVREVPMKNGDAHGVWKEYYNDGKKLRLEINYSMGKKEGMSTEYYDTGEKYVETPYVNNKIDGTQYRYKKDGTIVFEIPYKNGMPIPEIKEYDSKGKLVDQPSIKLTRKGSSLEMSMSNETKSAKFYMITDDNKLMEIPTNDGIGMLALNGIQKGSLKIRGTYTTAYKNKAAVDTQY